MHITTRTNRQTFARKQTVLTLRLVFSGSTVVHNNGLLVLAPGSAAIGRGVGANKGIDLAADSCASRVHAHVEVRDSPRDAGAAPRVRIVDAQSKNGTFVNGHRVAACELKDGDLIRVGDSFFVLRLQDPVIKDSDPGLLHGTSPAMRKLRQQLARIASSFAPALLLGESGTGKELAAKTLHEHMRSSGRLGPFVGVNCAAIPESLAESQLFGHVAGAFSDAKFPSTGFFRAAHGGTLFLDEVGELSPGLQAKLLRAIEEKAVVPVGATRAIACDVRLLAATHRDLLHDVQKGCFRGDLYARLSALPVELPPLRHRREDILSLLCRLFKGPLPRLSARLVERLLLYPWPFNVRELMQLAEYLLVHAGNAAEPDEPDEIDLPLVEDRLRLSAQDLVPSGPALTSLFPTPSSAAPKLAKLPPPPMCPPVPRDALLRLLTEHHGVVSRVADTVGRSRKQIYRWLEHYRIDHAPYRF